MRTRRARLPSSWATAAPGWLVERRLPPGSSRVTEPASPSAAGPRNAAPHDRRPGSGGSWSRAPSGTSRERPEPCRSSSSQGRCCWASLAGAAGEATLASLPHVGPAPEHLAAVGGLRRRPRDRERDRQLRPDRLGDAVVPFVSAYRPLLARLRSACLRPPDRADRHEPAPAPARLAAWRAVHWLAYACWPVALVHGARDRHRPRARLVPGALTCGHLRRGLGARGRARPARSLRAALAAARIATSRRPWPVWPQTVDDRRRRGS